MKQRAATLLDHQGSFVAHQPVGISNQALGRNEILGIVVRDYPEVMEQLAKSGYFQSEQVVWQLNRISE